MSCENCFHNEVCVALWKMNGIPRIGKSECAYFRDKGRYVELPCKIGDTVYCILTPCGGCPAFNEPMTEEYIEQCRVCVKAEIAELPFDYEMISEVGETVFTDRTKAEAALALWRSNNKEKEGNE